MPSTSAEAFILYRYCLSSYLFDKNRPPAIRDRWHEGNTSRFARIAPESIGDGHARIYFSTSNRRLHPDQLELSYSRITVFYYHCTSLSYSLYRRLLDAFCVLQRSRHHGRLLPSVLSDGFPASRGSHSHRIILLDRVHNLCWCGAFPRGKEI